MYVIFLIYKQVRLTMRKRENILTVPNILTTSRIVMTPYIAHLIVAGAHHPALVWFAVAATTDMVR